MRDEDIHSSLPVPEEKVDDLDIDMLMLDG
jgi:hypothetical protein